MAGVIDIDVYGRYIPCVKETAAKLCAVINNANDPSIATRFAPRRYGVRGEGLSGWGGRWRLRFSEGGSLRRGLRKLRLGLWNDYDCCNLNGVFVLVRFNPSSNHDTTSKLH